MWAIGLDIGGTKVRAAAVDDFGRVSFVTQLPTLASVGPDAVLEQCAQVIARVQEQVAEQTVSSEPSVQSTHAVMGAPDPFRLDACVGVGVASAGRIDPHTGTVLYSTDTFYNWHNTNIAQRISERVRLPVRVDNDVNAALLGEAWVGSARDCKRCAFIALGTGVGGALLEDGHLAHGATCSAGEFGHMLFQPGGMLCSCGARGCYEAYLAGPALAAQYETRCGREVGTRPLDARDVLAACELGETRAQQVVSEWIRCLAALLYSLQNGFDPQRIVIGGGIVDSARLWWPKLEQALCDYPIAIRPVPARAGNYAALIGAARLLFEENKGV